MKRGFSLVELVIALLLLQVGLLATSGMFLLSQQNLRRAELTLRGVLEAGIVADSLAVAGTYDPGEAAYDWGGLSWSPVIQPVRGLRVAAWVPVENDTLAAVLGFPPIPSTLPTWGSTLAADGGW